MRPTVLGLLLITLTYGCGGTSAESRARPTTPAAPAAAVAVAPVAAQTAPVSTGRIARADLEPVLAAGLGRFLQGVDTEPDLDAGHFVGFRLRSLYPTDARFAGIDLGAGDTIVRVNGQSIERPEQALEVWNGLHVASELMIEYLRRGQRKEIRFTIED